ncbi:hypothetical protein ACGF12_28970 [Kitasatospora sp. NPDC048296]|uniref:hypothetical protein n=1 Tax=Kitasatospora sp. NPDC048296 TaxID=3364048 RepID=UPI0037115C49
MLALLILPAQDNALAAAHSPGLDTVLPAAGRLAMAHRSVQPDVATATILVIIRPDSIAGT